MTDIDNLRGLQGRQQVLMAELQHRTRNGKLDVRWEVKDRNSAPEVALQWVESGVSVETPVRKGYGRELIERALPYQLNAKTQLNFAPSGVRCEIVVQIPPEHAHG